MTMAGPTVVLSIEQLRRLKITGAVTPGNAFHNGSVRLVGDLIRRSYNLGNPTHAERFVREVQILDRVRGADFVPQLVHVDLQRGELYHTTYGAPVSPLELLFNGANLSRETREAMLDLQNKYKVVRTAKLNPNRTTLNIPIRHLVRTNTGKLTIVGFDDPRWKLLPNSK